MLSDYSPLLPQELGPKLRDATTAWRSVNASQDAIILPLFTGVKGFEPDIFAVRNNVDAIGQALVPLCQDISSYAQLFVSIVGAVKDRQILANSLQVLVNRWHSLDLNDLNSLQSEVVRLLRYDVSEIKSIAAELEALSKKIATWIPNSTDPLFDCSLFDTATHIVEPIASFPFTTEGIARFADALSLPIRAVNVPLKKVFQKPLIGHPISTPDAVATAVSAVQKRIRKYFSNIDKVVSDVDNLIRYLDAAASYALLIPKGIEDFANKQSSDSPVDAGTAEKAWTEAGYAAGDFVSAVAGKSSVVASFAIKTFATRLDAIPTCADVESALDPPSYGASILSALAGQTLGISEQLTTVLMLPYTSGLKVKVHDAEVSLSEALLNAKMTYESIQNRTILAVRDIQTFSLMQKTILPIFEADLPVPPSELFSTWSVLVQSYEASAMQVTTECKALLETLQKYVSVLKSNINEVKARLAAELAAVQRAGDALKTQMLINGILAAVLTAGAIVASHTKQGELIRVGEIGGKAEESQVVQNDTKAGKTTLLIHKVERIIAIAESTSNQLDKVIPLVVGFVNSTTEICNVWADINGSLTTTQNDYTSWKDAGLLTTELLNILASRWASYETEAVHYVDKILGIQSPTTISLLSISLSGVSGVSEKELKGTDFGTPSDSDSSALRKFYELDNDPQLRSFMNPTTAEARIEKFEAPSITIDTNRQSLNNSAEQYKQAADMLQSLFPQDASSLRDLASRIDSDVIPPVTDCVDFYKTFANNQVSALSITPTKAGLEDLAAENARLSAQGMQKASDAQIKVLDFKNRSVNVNNSLIQRSNEMQLMMSSLQRELDEKKAKLAKYDIREYPFPAIKLIIKLIIEATQHIEEKIYNLQRQIENLQPVMYQVSRAHDIGTAALNTIVGLTQSWVNLTQEANDLATYLKVISEVPVTAPALAEDAKATWNGLNANLARW